ncbi:hypothetical protein COLO4_17994 [Corchorus olitorius]|uniref:Uncharacterized protein n=1 Tax=Corchorus olitorius TaxID=93759 RepID=A0A1R3JAT9_9ROSI|nr:hypothetical protein COLO4_17994 [Corchorus olitorius]
MGSKAKEGFELSWGWGGVEFEKQSQLRDF